MYLKSVTLDGFKSYGRRTVIDGFDKEFTAITGLNGTGKSNILDAICYAMGLSQLGQVRATSSQDLIFKRGQSDVKKAIVTLVFDNSAPNQCPMGYDKCRDISVSRTVELNKPVKNMINGKVVTFKKLQDFFCSVQLNVQNPSFLIMQGRITKVLNMKPPEILSMIEEAAGTSVYMKKREITSQILIKKEPTVLQTGEVLDDTIIPKLEQLRKECGHYEEYQNVCREIEFLERIHVSWRYQLHQKALSNGKANADKIIADIDSSKAQIVQNDAECRRIDDECKVLQEAVDAQSGGDMKEAEQELQNHLTAEAKATAIFKAQQASLLKEQKNKYAMEKGLADDEKALQLKETEMAQMGKNFEKLKDADAADRIAYEEAQRKYDAVAQGLTTDETGQASTLQDQLDGLKTQLKEAKTAVQTKNLSLRHARTLLDKKKNQSQTSDADYNKTKNAHDKLEAEIQQLSQNLNAMNDVEGNLKQLQQRKDALMIEVRKLNQQSDRLNHYSYELKYKDPEPNFDHSKIFGMVGKLFRVKDKQFSMAIQTAASGSLFNFVVDTDVTSQKLLDRGQLQRRVTFIPMNKIKFSTIDDSVVDFAKKLVGKDNVHSALSLVEYDKYFDGVMKYVLGRMLVCRDLETAKKVTYHPRILARCVTLDGDLTNPEGTLCGGSHTDEVNHVQNIADLQVVEQQITQRKTELRELMAQVQDLEKKYKNFDNIKKTLELRQHEFNVCKQRLAQTSFQQHQEEITSLEQQVQTLEQDIAQALETQKTAEIKIKDIESKLSDSKGYREREMQAAAAAMKAAQIKADKSHQLWQKHEKNYDVLKLEIEDLRKSIQRAKDDLIKIDVTIANIETELVNLEKSRDNATEMLNVAKQKIKIQKEKINSQNKELRNLYAKKDKLQKHNDELNLDIKKKGHEVDKLKIDGAELAKKIADLERKYIWIREEVQYFGIQNTRYDYNKQDPKEAGKKLDSLRKKRDEMSRHVNTSAMVLLERAEENYVQAKRRRSIAKTDKAKITNIMYKMDDRKCRQVDSAWQDINNNFSSIFSTLLQGAQARLVAVKEDNTLIGLEIQVGFNNVWKDSLSELSGGQRSLVALSLVLAMLKYSPAPLYILDEVDAALDMSHTQNIGNMMSEHFTGSQFIIVSLKDGMFNNANVLFRTKFEDGVSGVVRQVNSKKK